MFVRGPDGQAEDIALSPVELLPVNDCGTTPSYHVVDHTAGMAVSPRLLAGAEELDPAIDGWHDRTTGKGVGKLQRDPIIGATIAIFQLHQPLFSSGPTVI